MSLGGVDNPAEGVSFASQHATTPQQSLKVAPTDGSAKFNTIRIPLIPVACWRLNDPAFAFDSSFVSPAFRDELTTLSGIVAANPGCPASLFGHCDPAGSDTLNKTLGDRRAMAIYALVTRQPDLWTYLYDNQQVGDTWDLHMVQTMLASMPDGQGNPYYSGTVDGIQGPQTTDAVKRFQGDAGQGVDGDPGPATRKALFGAYMDWLCTASSGASDAGHAGSAPAPFRMQPTDFLGGAGAQAGDLPKMSLQSCGKFNPVVLVPSSEMTQSDTTSRNVDDAPNRRAIMFFFRKGVTVPSSQWPCPKVKEPNDACQSAFWPEGDSRRQNGDSLRLYAETRDTMACRFYDRLARRSPCERPQLIVPPLRVAVLLQPNADGTTDNNVSITVQGGETLDGGEGQRTGNYVVFELDPEQMPNPCQLSLTVDQVTGTLGQEFNPISLRDALCKDDMTAADIVFGPLSPPVEQPVASMEPMGTDPA